MTLKSSIAFLIAPVAALSMGCQPVSTASIPQQEDAIQVDGQTAMETESGTLGDPQVAELGATQPEGINFADPDPFIDYDTVHQEEGIEGDEND